MNSTSASIPNNHLRKHGTVKPAAITVATVSFCTVFVQAILSYPVNIMVPSGLYSMAEEYAGGPAYMTTAFNATLVTFSTLLLLYRILPTRRLIEEFQRKPFEKSSQLHYQRVWRWTCGIILANCIIMFIQAGYSFPLARSFSMDYVDYGVYRREVDHGVNGTIANLTLHLLVPIVYFIAFKCMPSTAIENRVGAILVAMLAALFSLSRTFLAAAVVVLILAQLACTPVYFRLRDLFRGLMVIMVVLTITLMFIAISTRGYFDDAFNMLFERTIHGQWLGLPLYLCYFEAHPASVTSFLHPALQVAFGMTVESTPGRELMEYFMPEEAKEGTAGVIPTLFIGEAFAVAGWLGVAVSVLYVSGVFWLIAYVMGRMKKTYWSCCIYGWIMYKFATGLMLGISAFLVAGLLVAVVLLLVVSLLAEAQAVLRQPGGVSNGPRSLRRREFVQ